MEDKEGRGASVNSACRIKRIISVPKVSDTGLRNFRLDIFSMDKDDENTKQDLTLLKASTSILYKNRMDVKPLSKPVFVDAPSPELKEEDDSIEVSSYFHDEDRYEDFSNYDDESSSDSISVKLLINKTPTSKMSVNYSDVEQDSKESPVIRTEIPSLEKKTFHILSELRKSCPAKNVVSASGYLPCEAVEVNCDIFGSSDTNVEDVGQLTPIKPSNKREGTFDEKEQRGIGLRNFRFDKNALKEQENSDTCESSDMIVEDVRQLTPINSCNDGEGTIDETESREVKLRNFRFDKEKAVKEQVKLLRHIHIEEEECFREKEFTSLHANNSTPGVKTGGLSGDARTHTPGKLRKLVNNLNIRANFNKPYKIFVVKSSGMAQSSLSKPVFVDAPSPNSKNKDDEYNNEKSTIYVDESSSDNPLGGMSMKLLINKTSPSKVSVNCSDVEQDSQDSPVIRTKVAKRVRFLASSDEDEDLIPPAKKQQLNGHDSASEDSSMPDEGIIEKFIDMWEKVYPFVDKMDVLDIYRQNDWDAKLTMEQLEKTNRKNKDKHKLKKMGEEMAKKRELAEQRVEKKKQKVAEKELASMARTAMKEKLKARKQAWKGKAVSRNDDQDMEEDEDDYHFGGSKVYDSEDDESGGEEDPKKTGDRHLVLKFFNEASVGELAAIGGCSRKKAEVIAQIRPFKDWTDIVYKFQTEKFISAELLNEAKTVLHVRNTVQKLMKRCETIANNMQSIVSRIVSGEEDAGISKQPTSLNPSMQLKSYQLIGLNWLVLMHEQGLNGVLADEMGLGKTVQAISFLSHIKEAENPDEISLIIVPSSTLDNWARELELWCPSLEVLQYHGSQDERRAIRCAIMNNNLEEEPDVILTTYNMVSTSAEDKALFKKLRFHTVVLDEAHMLKNMASQRYENLMKIKALRRVLLTGTPLQNNLVELMSILIYVMPQLFDSKKEELKRVFSMFPKGDGGGKGKFERERIEQAKRIMKPFFLRRLKCDVLKDLPPKHDEIIHVPMSKRQQKIYSDTVLVLSKRAQQHQLDLEKLNLKELTEIDDGEATGDTKKKKDRDGSSNMVTTLRKIANHPLLIRKYYDDNKVKEIAKILKKTTHLESILEYIIEDFSVMSDFEIHTTCDIYKPIKHHRLPEEILLSSGKFEQLDVLLPKLKEEGSRVLIFSQFVILLNILEQYIILRGHKYLRFDGTTQVAERQDLIDQFTEEDDIFVFLLSTRAGGLGINLTAADTVIIHDIDFNPYNDKQAEDRCHRVGQTRPVRIIRLVSKDTIEDGMLQIAQDKLQLERDVTGLEDDQQKKSDVVTLLKAALGLVKTDGQSSSLASTSESEPL